jgi:hypothetical protein
VCEASEAAGDPRHLHVLPDEHRALAHDTPGELQCQLEGLVDV